MRLIGRTSVLGLAMRLLLAASLVILSLVAASARPASQTRTAEAALSSPGDAMGTVAANGPSFGAGNSVARAGLAAPSGAAGMPWTPPKPAYRLYVDADGMYRLDYSYLSSEGLPVDSIDPATFQIYQMGTEIAIQVTGDGDAQFEPGEAVVFYGRSLDSLFYDGLTATNKYTGTNIYWLTYGGAPGLRMAAKGGSAAGSTPGPFPHRIHIEANSQYISNYPTQVDADHWYDFKRTPSGPSGSSTAFYPFDASRLVTAAPDGLLKVALLGNYDGAHNLRVLVNGQKAFEQSNLWSGFDPVTVQIAVPSSYFVQGSNLVQVQIYNSGKTYDEVYPNWVEVTYYDDYYAEGDALAFGNNTAGTWRYQVSGFTSSDIQVYDVTDMAAVGYFTNATVSGTSDVSFVDTNTGAVRYVAVSANGWLTPSQFEPVVDPVSPYTIPSLLDTRFGADYIIISHADFWPEAVRLARYRAHDFRVMLVDVQSIYDQFNGGMMSAEAVHDFLAYAYANWKQPAPAYVVLMGDGTSDPRNYKGGSAPTFIPPYLYPADPTLGETAADNRFVTLVGNDITPEMHIGRLPVNDLTQARAMVDKIIKYETQCTCGSWNYNTVFVADNLEGGGGNFYDYSDMIADGFADPETQTTKLVPVPPYQVQKIYLKDPTDTRGTCSQNLNVVPPVTQCTDQLVSTLNNTGALFVSYVGHSTKQYWAGEHIWDVSSAASPPLTNGPCLPIMLPMTCFEGSFHEPGATFTSLAEASTRLPIHGAIASLSPTGFGLVNGHDSLERGLLIALLHNNVDRLGAAVDYAKSYLLANSPANADLVDTFVLLGDPALQPKTDYVCSLVPTAVLMSSFEAHRTAAGVRLSWLTGSEVDMVGFNVLRSEGAGALDRVNDELLPAKGAGSEQGNTYSYVDGSADANKSYVYRLQVVKPDGASQEYGPANVPAADWKFRYLPLLSR